MAIGAAAVLTTAAIRPLLDHYLQAMGEVGVPHYGAQVFASIPDWRSWFYMGPWSWAWGWMPRLMLFMGMGLEQSKRSGIGLVTPWLCLAGLLACRRRPDVRLVVLATLGLLMAVMRFDRQIAEGVALGLWTACMLGLYRGAVTPAGRWALGGLASLLAPTIFAGVVLPIPMALAGLLFLTSRPPPGRPLAGIRRLALASAIAFPLLVSHAHRAAALGLAIPLSAVLAVVGSRGIGEGALAAPRGRHGRVRRPVVLPGRDPALALCQPGDPGRPGAAGGLAGAPARPDPGRTRPGLLRQRPGGGAGCHAA